MKPYFSPYKYPRRKAIFTDADTAVRKIHKGKRILLGSGCAVPQHLVAALVRNARHFKDNEIGHILTVGPAPYTDARYTENFRHSAFFIGKNTREAVNRGDADYVPIFLSEVPLLFKTGQLPLHAAVVQVTPPDKRGRVSLGVSIDVLPAAISRADIVIAQINPRMPFTLGEGVLPLTAFDYLVEAEEPLQEFAQGKIDEVSMKIGTQLSRYIKDGDTLQLGIGGIPDAVLSNIIDKNDLGIHTELVSDGVVELYKRKIITNTRKGVHKGKSILGFVLGSQKVFDLIHENPDFHFYPTEYTNDPFIIAQNKNMVSINSAIQIDLSGQVCSDSIGTRLYSGFGGQVDFVRGAKRSDGGRSFIALPSTAKNGRVSRIVPTLTLGGGVVTSRGDVHYVVTEYGVAYLHSKNIRERALALIQIAHPKFRDELLDYVKERHTVYIDQKTVKDDNSPVKDLIPYSQTFKNKKVYFRPLRPFDEKAIQDFFYSHRPQTVYQRYLTYVESMPLKEAQKRVAVDYNTDMAIAGFDSPQPYAHMVCLGRYTRKNDNSAELGFVVKESWQKIGIGTFLCSCLINAARYHGITKLYGYVALNNPSMLKVFEKNGFQVKKSDKDEHYYVEFDRGSEFALDSAVI